MDANTTRTLHKGRERWIGGVCTGLAEYFAVDVTIVRIVFVLLAMSGVGIVLYLLLWALMPEPGSSPVSGADTISSGLRSVEADIRRIGGELKGPAGSPGGTTP